jgi:hypothetical protein
MRAVLMPENAQTPPHIIAGKSFQEREVMGARSSEALT